MWSEIPLDDYEAHMAHPSVGQAAMLADEFARAISESRPSSVAVLGCAGGNGFERAVGTTARRVVGIDINHSYLARAAQRFAGVIPDLELHCLDLSAPLPPIAPVELIFAALIFEYLDITVALRNIRKLGSPRSRLIAILQQPAADVAAVTPTGLRRLDALAAAFTHLDPDDLVTRAGAHRFREAERRTVRLASTKSFYVITLERGWKCDDSGGRNRETQCNNPGEPWPRAL